jgi:hypothetical protein
MTKREEPGLAPRDLAAYVAGEVTPSEGAAIEAALADSPALQRRVESLRRVQQRLMSPLPEVETIDLVPGLNARVASARRAVAPRPERAPRWRLIFGAVGALGCAAAALALIVRPGPNGGFHSKAASGDAAGLGRFSGVHAYRVPNAGAVPKRLGTTMSPGDGLLFDYVNLATRPFPFLMIFGIDAQGEVRWFYPAYEKAETNPTSLAIMKGRVALKEAVYHDLPRGRFAVHALFTADALHVREVEAWLTRRRPGAALPWSGAFEQVIETTVE